MMAKSQGISQFALIFTSLLLFLAMRNGLRTFGVHSKHSLRMMSHSAATVNTLPRVVLQPLPKLYVYDHCPFCVRVRLAFGLKNIKHEVHFLANDDVDTPTKLVGKKIAPIFEIEAKSIKMPESLDIIQKVDSDPDFGPINALRPFTTRTDLKEWQNKHADLGRILQRPRYMKTLLPEFASRDSRNTFIKNHPLPGYEKKDWAANFNQQQRSEIFEQGYQASLERVNEASQALADLDQLIYSEDYCSEGGLSLDDVDLWSRLRSMTLVKGITFPSKLHKYMTNLSEKGDLPLYFSIAC